LREWLYLLAIVLLILAGAAGVKMHIDRLERDLKTARADAAQAQAQAGLNEGAASAERNLAVRDRTIVLEVDRGRADLEAASALGRDAVLVAWADAARRLRSEPAASAALAGDAALGP